MSIGDKLGIGMLERWASADFGYGIMAVTHVGFNGFEGCRAGQGELVCSVCTNSSRSSDWAYPMARVLSVQGMTACYLFLRINSNEQPVRRATKFLILLPEIMIASNQSRYPHTLTGVSAGAQFPTSLDNKFHEHSQTPGPSLWMSISPRSFIVVGRLPESTINGRFTKPICKLFMVLPPKPGLSPINRVEGRPAAYGALEDNGVTPAGFSIEPVEPTPESTLLSISWSIYSERRVEDRAQTQKTTARAVGIWIMTTVKPTRNQPPYGIIHDIEGRLMEEKRRKQIERGENPWGQVRDSLLESVVSVKRNLSLLTCTSTRGDPAI
ncbi:hypothetical protein F5141DRAFT_1206827 [Pisolithus sp. B1]|nr:hypothetical protein F5141DRAFT_1206827 [Pisolithus sp. B1]